MQKPSYIIYSIIAFFITSSLFAYDETFLSKGQDFTKDGLSYEGIFGLEFYNNKPKSLETQLTLQIMLEYVYKISENFKFSSSVISTFDTEDITNTKFGSTEANIGISTKLGNIYIGKMFSESYKKLSDASVISILPMLFSKLGINEKYTGVITYETPVYKGLSFIYQNTLDNKKANSWEAILQYNPISNLILSAGMMKSKNELYKSQSWYVPLSDFDNDELETVYYPSSSEPGVELSLDNTINKNLIFISGRYEYTFDNENSIEVMLGYKHNRFSGSVISDLYFNSGVLILTYSFDKYNLGIGYEIVSEGIGKIRSNNSTFKVTMVNGLHGEFAVDVTDNIRYYIGLDYLFWKKGYSSTPLPIINNVLTSKSTNVLNIGIGILSTF